MAHEVIDVETWLVRRCGGHIDATVWAPKGAGVAEAQALALAEHGTNATAVRRPAEEAWHAMPATATLPH